MYKRSHLHHRIIVQTESSNLHDAKLALNATSFFSSRIYFDNFTPLKSTSKIKSRTKKLYSAELDWKAKRGTL